MCSISFWTTVGKLPRVQQLVKRYDGRFPPMRLRHDAPDVQIYVDIKFADVSNMNRFNIMHLITEQRFF